MLPGGLRQIGRLALGGLALVAASYHLTETWHREVEYARQKKEASQKPVGGAQDKQKNNPKQRPVLCWLAPDMLHRSVLQQIDGESVSIRGGADTAPGLRVADGFTLRDFRGAFGPAAAAERDAGPICRTYLSDRSAHGPPAIS
jgi:hypothetical protein